jgi:peptidoglycan/LPS O-acetylase OafA/YrhL
MREICVRTSLGTWRFFLAFVVVISHLWAGMIDGPAAYAVWGFFVLSGYLMTLVLTTKYGTATVGLRQFAANRLLRVYPSFIVAVVAGIATILALRPLGIDPAGLNPQFMLPQNTSDWLGNLAMVPFVAQQGLPVPVAAALFVEVWAYALMPLFASSRGAALLGLAVAICANLQFGFGMPTFIPRYGGFATGLMPFAAGAVVYHYRDELRRFASPRLSILAWCGHGLYWLHDVYWPWTYGLWLSIPLSAWVVLSLAEAKSRPAKSGTVDKFPVDKFLGELSYPIYLLHTTVAAWFLPHFGFGRGFTFFAVSFAATLLASWFMLLLVDRPMRLLRFELRPLAMHPVTKAEPYQIHTGRRAVP